MNTLGVSVYKRESKQGMQQYLKQLEKAIAAYKKQLQSLQKDHDILNQSYIFELNRNSKIEHASTVVKRALNKLVGQIDDNRADESLLCMNCSELQEIKTL